RQFLRSLPPQTAQHLARQGGGLARPAHQPGQPFQRPPVLAQQFVHLDRQDRCLQVRAAGAPPTPAAPPCCRADLLGPIVLVCLPGIIAFPVRVPFRRVSRPRLRGQEATLPQVVQLLPRKGADLAQVAQEPLCAAHAPPPQRPPTRETPADILPR